MSKTITTSQAVAEINRRRDNKGLDKADKTPAASQLLERMTGPQLAELASLALPEPTVEVAPVVVEAPAPKADRTAAEKRATTLRRQAWEWRLAQRKAGTAVSYADACKRFRVKPANAV